MMFPEGTRSSDGRLKAFKPGAFALAIDTGSPVLPIVLEGTSDALPKRGFVLRGHHHIRVRVLDEIPASEFKGMSIAALSDRTRNRIAAELGEPSDAERPKRVAEHRRQSG